MHADADKGCSDRALQHVELRSGCCALLGTRRGWGDGGWSCRLPDGSHRGLPAFGGGDGWLADQLRREDGAWGLVSECYDKKRENGIPYHSRCCCCLWRYSSSARRSCS